MLGRRVFQSLLAIAACLALAATFGPLYLVPAVIATLIAVGAGVYAVTGVMLGLVWPVLAFAYALHVASGMRLRSRAQEAHGAMSHHPPRRPPTG